MQSSRPGVSVFPGNPQSPLLPGLPFCLWLSLALVWLSIPAWLLLTNQSLLWPKAGHRPSSPSQHQDAALAATPNFRPMPKMFHTSCPPTGPGLRPAGKPRDARLKLTWLRVPGYWQDTRETGKTCSQTSESFLLVK